MADLNCDQFIYGFHSEHKYSNMNIFQIALLFESQNEK